MEQIRNWAMALSAVIVLGTLAESIIPNGNYRKYIHMVMAILLIISVISPLLNLRSDGFLNASGSSASYEYDADETSEKIRYRQQKDIIDIYKNTLEDSLINQLEQIYPGLKGKLSVKITADESDKGFGHIKNAAVILCEETDVNLNEIKKSAADALGIQTDSVAVVE